MNTTENNKLIAQFMGYGAQLHLVEHPTTGEYVDAEFHTSWDWLIPVANKILNTEGDMNDLAYEVQEQCAFVNKEGIYNAVTEFIKWYNKNNEVAAS